MVGLAIRRLSREPTNAYIPLDGLFAEQLVRIDKSVFSQDGIHPTDYGHAFIAREWLRAVGAL